jgi:L-ribulose-5-phosphate 4-epimerase
VTKSATTIVAGDPGALEEVRRTVASLHALLISNQLVSWTAGNISGRVPGTELFVIKPSGVDYADLTPESMVVCDLDGTVIDGAFAPSSDTSAHAYIYRHLSHVGAVVHTHSTFASAWAARGEPVPCVLTAMADEFGGEIPVGPFALIGDDSIGRGVVDVLSHHRSPAVLMQNHGVFAVGATPRAAVKAAVMCEDVARTVHFARVLGSPIQIDPADIDRLYERYTSEYGQTDSPSHRSI